MPLVTHGGMCAQCVRESCEAAGKAGSDEREEALRKPRGGGGSNDRGGGWGVHVQAVPAVCAHACVRAGTCVRARALTRVYAYLDDAHSTAVLCAHA